MTKQLYKEGDIIELKKQKLECTFVSYQVKDGEKYHFTYSFRDADEVAQERKDTNPDQEEIQ